MRPGSITDLLIRHHKKLARKFNDEGLYGRAELHILRAEELEREQDNRANHEATAIADILAELN